MLFFGETGFEVLKIGFNEIGLTILYTVLPECSYPETNEVAKQVFWHQDFAKVFNRFTYLCIPHFCGMQMTPEEFTKKVYVDKIIFLPANKKGYGVKIKFSLEVDGSTEALAMTTPKYWTNPRSSDNRMTKEEVALMDALKTEAFFYAYQNKRNVERDPVPPLFNEAGEPSEPEQKPLKPEQVKIVGGDRHGKNRSSPAIN